MLPWIIGCKSSWGLWDCIHSFFHSITTARTRHTRLELSNINLDGKTISEYFLHVQTLIDEVVAIGESISSKEHIQIVLDGLSEEYEASVSFICNHLHNITIEEVESILLAHEARLDKFRKKPLATANVTIVLRAASNSVSQPQVNVVEQPNPNARSSQNRGGCFIPCGGRLTLAMLILVVTVVTLLISAKSAIAWMKLTIQ